MHAYFQPNGSRSTQVPVNFVGIPSYTSFSILYTSFFFFVCIGEWGGRLGIYNKKKNIAKTETHTKLYARLLSLAMADTITSSAYHCHHSHYYYYHSSSSSSSSPSSLSSATTSTAASSPSPSSSFLPLLLQLFILCLSPRLTSTNPHILIRRHSTLNLCSLSQPRSYVGPRFYPASAWRNTHCLYPPC
ncbi:hypothetical protein F4810DRAFT_240041 [Camillea tinctor]|nr:hypothetical protein F4810DRAFT_240041 [Camillea tinctor]